MALQRNALKKAASTLALCLIYAAVLIYLIVSRPVMPFAGVMGTLFLILTAVTFLPCVYFSCRGVSLYAKAIRDPETDSSAGDFLSLDKAVILSSLMLVILAAYLLLDFLL